MICNVCQNDKDCRPYGEQHSMICFSCMKVSPQREAEAIKNFSIQFNGAGPIVAVGTEVGPFPFSNMKRPTP